MESGLPKIAPDRKDYSLLHTFAAIIPDPAGLPDNFSVYDGRTIPNQMSFDGRFSPALAPLPLGCTGESGSFDAGIQDGKLYRPDELYENTTPFVPTTGRQIRDMLQRLIDVGPMGADGVRGPKRHAYFNCYAAGNIDDFDAARIGLWINQHEKRSVIVGLYWYRQFAVPLQKFSLDYPSFNIKMDGSLHCIVVTGWRTNNGVVELEVISWQGEEYANAGIAYMSREIYNALLQQPWTGAFTTTKLDGRTPIPIGIKAIIDHLVYYIRSLWHL